VNIPNDSRVEKWVRWIDDPIKNEVLGVFAQRHVHQSLAKMTQLHGGLPPSHFFDNLSAWYASSQALAIRRQAEGSSRVVSLGRLLVEVRDDPERLTMTRFVSHARDELLRGELAATFARLYGGNTGTHVDPALVEQDLTALTVAAADVKEYVDRHLAHSDANRLSALPTFATLNGAIDQLGETFRKYALLLIASSWATLVPVIQYDWLAPFREPWLLPEHEDAVRHAD
jgi:hypothetical protein